MKAPFVINADVVDQELLDQYRAAAKPSMANNGPRMLAMRLATTSGIALLVDGRE